MFLPRFDVLFALTIRVHTHGHIETVLFIVLISVISHKIKMFTKLVIVMIWGRLKRKIWIRSFMICFKHFLRPVASFVSVL